jgi:hypothetical protein
VQALGNLGRRLVAWLIIAVAAVLLLKILWGIVAGFLHAILLAVALVVVLGALFWALRRV